MLTLKIFNNDGSYTIRQARSVSKYPSLARKEWVWWEGDTTETELDDYSTIYVMNDQGATVDTLRKRKQDEPRDVKTA